MYDVSRPKLHAAMDDYLESCFSNESPPLVGDLATKLGAPPWQLTRAVKRLFRISLHEYFKRAQIRRAKRLLQNQDLLLNEVAYRCAFVTRATFFHVFRQRTGLTPAEYRRRLQPT
jgi:AraC-like DNA-binding protein